jgi:3-hydroxyacyl-CoA dehydrogenase
MSEVIEQIHSEVLTLQINNPPVNAMNQRVRSALLDALTRASQDSAIEAVVIVGSGKTFVAGADIREFAAASQGPTSLEIHALLDAFEKPVIAAIHGAALGGGLELALAAHHRVALASAAVGLPEIHVGVLPGAGGTQRLPRLVGVESALDLILSGRHVEAKSALELGIIDALLEGSSVEQLMRGAVAYARERIDHSLPLRRIRDDRSKLDAVDPAVFERTRRQNMGRWHGLLAPWMIVDCIEAACTKPWEEGNSFERRAFLECRESPQRAALVHVFFAERRAAKVPPASDARTIKAAAVIGAGTMGAGIATVFASNGIAVQLLETGAEPLRRGLASIRQNLEASVTRGLMRASEAEAALSRVSGTLSYEEISECDLAVEAVFERLLLKQDIFRKLDDSLRRGSILASNTSTLDIDKIASVTRRPDDVIGMHFFSPAHVMKLLEVIRGANTSDSTIASLFGLARTLCKIPVLSGNCHGFIGNRILYAYGREADFLLEEGATPWQVDEALKGFGLPMGIYRMRDMAGLDIGWNARKERAATRPKDLRYSVVADRICEQGRFGQKTGAGYYRYDGRTALPDPDIERLIAGVSDEMGISRRSVSQSEIVDRVLLAMVNEGARVVGEGIAQRASDIDVTYVNGYGFPRYLGGPMYWAERQGLAEVLSRVSTLQQQHGVYWTPAPLLHTAAQLGSWDAAQQG